jgi:lipopolysaccharide transport system ATP-binding protein
MNSDIILKVEGLHKKFCRSLKRSMYYGLTDLARGMVGAQISDELREGEFWALQDINFELKRGETLGLIGQNGCGKSTLLRLINGIFPPDKGRITVRGRTGALIAVGAGFHPHMTGRENIYLNGTILGMSKDEITRKFDAIVDFADIGEFIDAPVATYSSGMTVRLGFAIAIHCEPDLLLIDEILAVGDANFRAKCFNAVNKVSQSAATILVSHSMPLITRVATRGIHLIKGKVVVDDTDFERVINSYTDTFEGVERRVVGAGLVDVRRMTVPQSICYGDDLVVEAEYETGDFSGEYMLRYIVIDQEQAAVAQFFSPLLCVCDDGKPVKLRTRVPQVALTNGKFHLHVVFIAKDHRGPILARYDNIASFSVRNAADVTFAPFCLRSTSEKVV